uniref:Uncharacterized protein n=1 Tax=Rhizophora mucronata TaxID=61149 RepID=A0A2P2QUJ6_RHIMU
MNKQKENRWNSNIVPCLFVIRKKYIVLLLFCQFISRIQSKASV